MKSLMECFSQDGLNFIRQQLWKLKKIRVVTPGKNRKLPESSTTISGSDLSSTGDGTRNHSQLQVIDDEDDLVKLDNGNLDSFKKKRLQ